MRFGSNDGGATMEECGFPAWLGHPQRYLRGISDLRTGALLPADRRERRRPVVVEPQNVTALTMSSAPGVEPGGDTTTSWLPASRRATSVLAVASTPTMELSMNETAVRSTTTLATAARASSIASRRRRDTSRVTSR